MSSGPFLMTERLILRPPAAQDMDEWAAFCADEKVMHHLGGPQTRSEAWRSLCSVAGAWQIRGFAMFSMIRRDTGEWIGRTGPWMPEDWPGKEIGWGVARAQMGKGYAYEAAVASMDYVFDVLRWDDVIHTIAPDNIASQKLARRLGSVNLGPSRLPAPFADHPVDAWGQSREEWSKNRKNLRA
ncbi:GNAT family N-acetyltransferase [Sphingorhabdus arenilitoris]|uniref:GNAT family N-acetyltransferase n=1 Tax=Sphingorhabdus arenilitoris TaxID=1490041 RepID=A0ABV8RE21_9SPHN